AGTPDESVTDVDGLATTHTDPAPTAATADPLGVTCIDHLVVMTPDLDRTVAAVEGHLGLPCRRVREAGGGVVQAFFRMGEVVLEVVTSPQVPDGSARFWGITFTVRDLDAAAARLGPERAGEPKPAVQPGRRIVTVRKAAGLAIPVALMDADPRR
ncbi:MAG TPA: VOC family protein, partial [Acidimicrobiales bacterium]